MTRLELLPFIVLALGAAATGCDRETSTSAPEARDTSTTADASAGDAGSDAAAASARRLATPVPPLRGLAPSVAPSTTIAVAAALDVAGTVAARDAAGRHAQHMAARDARRVARAQREQAALDARARELAEDRARTADSETLVWGELEGIGTTTFRVSRFGDELSDNGASADARVVTDAGVWEWQTHATHPRLSGCDLGDGARSRPERPRGDAMRADMARLDSRLRTRARQTVVTAARADGAADLTQHASLVASLGPYVFVIDSVYAYECGAHGNSAAQLVVWDLRTGSAVPLAGAPGVAAMHEALEPAAIVSIRAEMGEDGTLDGGLFADRAQLSAVLPFFDARGRLGAEAHFTMDACYACGDGEWGSYSRSARVRTPDMPALLRAVPLDAAAIALVAAEQPKLRSLGASTVSRPSAAVTETLDTLFATEGC